MFKEKYKKDMDTIVPSEEAINKTKEKMTISKLKRPNLFGKRQLIALATCFCLILGSFAAVLLTKEPFNNNEEFEDLENPYVIIPDFKVVTGKALTLNSGLNYAEIFDKLDATAKLNNGFYRYGSQFTNEDALVDEEIIPNKDTGASNGSTDYSDTNNQVAGVQEADIIKTDGKYIYACGKTNEYYGYYMAYDSGESNVTAQDTKGRVYILSAVNGEIELVSTIKIRDDEENTHYVLTEILLYEDILILIKSGYKIETATENSEYKYYSGYYNSYNYTTSVEIYDITDRANPVFKNELYQSGYYNSSRMTSENLYLITTHYVYNPDEENPESYIPYCSSYAAEYLVPAGCIYVADEMTNAVYTVVTGIDVTKPDNHISDAAVLGFAGTVYSSGDNIYIAAFRSNDIYSSEVTTTDDVAVDFAVAGSTSASEAAPDEMSSTNTTSTAESPKTISNGMTDLYRFQIAEGVVTYTASGSVDGNLLNQFAMDEYNGAFRLATTVYEYQEVHSYNEYNSSYYTYYNQTTYYNNLYILDKNLNVTGQITKIAPNEKIYSVRFDGEIGYMVTFRQTDPLFAIDLSNTTKPEILSALKIPGFSSYMQPYGEGLLFGFGKDADENGSTNGLKLSMFDVSDKTNVTEQSVLTLGSAYYYSAALDNHKAILVNAGKNLIGFPVISYDNNNSGSGYAFYTYENKEFVEVGSISLSNNYKYEGLRGLYIGEYVYIFSEDEFITSYNLSDFNQVDTVSFTN